MLFDWYVEELPSRSVLMDLNGNVILEAPPYKGPPEGEVRFVLNYFNSQLKVRKEIAERKKRYADMDRVENTLHAGRAVSDRMRAARYK